MMEGATSAFSKLHPGHPSHREYSRLIVHTCCFCMLQGSDAAAAIMAAIDAAVAVLNVASAPRVPRQAVPEEALEQVQCQVVWYLASCNLREVVCQSMCHTCMGHVILALGACRHAACCGTTCCTMCWPFTTHACSACTGRAWLMQVPSEVDVLLMLFGHSGCLHYQTCELSSQCLTWCHEADVGLLADAVGDKAGSARKRQKGGPKVASTGISK